VLRSPRLIASLAALCVLALGVAACGSSSDDNKTESAAAAPSGAPKGGTINGAGATFPAPV
jgi:ABC-type phosphate transport system substrate-binding protein